jgi:hypothetical protein
MENGNWKLETGNWKIETGNWKIENRTASPHSQNPRLQLLAQLFNDSMNQ